MLSEMISSRVDKKLMISSHVGYCFHQFAVDVQLSQAFFIHISGFHTYIVPHLLVGEGGGGL